jgi:hypothetical protein
MSEPREQEPEVPVPAPEVQSPSESGALSESALESVAGGTTRMPTLPPTDPPPYFPEDPFGPLY